MRVALVHNCFGPFVDHPELQADVRVSGFPSHWFQIIAFIDVYGQLVALPQYIGCHEYILILLACIIRLQLQSLGIVVLVGHIDADFDHACDLAVVFGHIAEG